MKRQYTLIEDPGHSWLEVPVKDVREAGVFNQITNFSPVKRGKMYLEEDCDAPTFLLALQAKKVKVDIKEIHVNDFDEYLANIFS